MGAPADVSDDAIGESGRDRPFVLVRLDRDGLVPASAAVLIVAHLLLRGWATAGGWFVREDFLAIAAAGDRRVAVPGPPGAAALAHAVASVAPGSWVAVAGLELLAQLLVDLLLYRLLVGLFGRRPAVLLPLSVYLASTLPLVGGTWWSAALVHLPVQIAVLTAARGHLRHLRRGRWGAAVVSAVAVAVGLLFSGGLVLLPPALFAATLLWWTDGRLPDRLRAAARRPVWLLQGAALATGLGLRALAHAGPLLTDGMLAEGVHALPRLLWRTVLPGLVGGPWLWSSLPSALALPDPPAALAWASAVVVGVVILGSILVQRGAARAWLLALPLTAVVLFGDGGSPAGSAGERLPAGVVPPAVLALLAAVCLGLAFLPVRGAPAVLDRRAWTTRTTGLRLSGRLVRPVPAAAAVAVLAAGTLLSTAGFADRWWDNAARAYVDTARTELAARPDVVLVDGPAPESVVAASLAPANTVSTVLSTLAEPPRFLPDHRIAYELAMLDDRGRLELAYVDPVTESGTGPIRDCGWVAGPDAVDIPLQRATGPGRWMVQLSYLAGVGNAVYVTVGKVRLPALLGSGLHDIYLQTTGRFDEVRVEVEDPRHPVCVSAVRVGTARPLPPEQR